MCGQYWLSAPGIQTHMKHSTTYFLWNNGTWKLSGVCFMRQMWLYARWGGHTVGDRWCTRIIHTCKSWCVSKRVKSSTINLWQAVNTKGGELGGRDIWFYHLRKSSEETLWFYQLRNPRFQFWYLFHFRLRKSASLSTVLPPCNTCNPKAQISLCISYRKHPGFIFISRDLILHSVSYFKLMKKEKVKKKGGWRGNVKHMCSKPLRFCKCYAVIIVSGRQVIPLLCNNDNKKKRKEKGKRMRYAFDPYIVILLWCSVMLGGHAVTVRFRWPWRSVLGQVWMAGNLSRLPETGCQPWTHKTERWFTQ